VSRLLLIGYSTEGTLAHFKSVVAAEGVEHEVLDLAALRGARDLTITDDAGDLVVSIDDDVFRFSEFTAIYARCYFFELGTPGRNRGLSTLIQSILGYLEHTRVPVANRPSAGAGNGNKLAHLATLRDAGFTFPEAHVLGDGALARTLVTADGSWISKSCSSMKTRAAAVDEALYARLDRLSVCPSLFQRRIRGFDVRVHVVGSECIAEKIVSTQIDYRYREPGAPRADFSAIEVPDPVARACVKYCSAQRLLFAGIDFKVSDDGTWYVLEANPMPGYDPYDRRLGKRISHALLRLLTTGGAVDDEPFITASRRPVPSPFA
jgi:glutathione synthase/RimK-type ligase-like ATP-grasp enzyme